MSTSNPSAVEKLLGCGRFQGLTFICFQWIVFVQAWNMVFMVFGKCMPSKWSFANSTHENSDGNETSALYSCECTKSPEGCQNFTWEAEFYSIVPHWQLVCDRVKIIYFIMTVQMIGVFLGSPIFGQISDTFGRKWTLFGTVLTLIIFGTSSAFSPSWQVFAGLRFLVGLCLGGTISTSVVLLMEMLTQKHRLWVSSIGGWPLAFLIIPLLAYLAPDWRGLAIVTNLAGLPALLFILFIGESPRWLIQKGKLPQADAQLRRIVRINKHELDEKILASITETWESNLLVPDTNAISKNTNAQKKYTYWHLFSTKSMAITITVLATCYVCGSIVSNGVVFSVDKLSGNLFLNFFLLALLRWIMNAVTIIADLLFSKFGRKIGVLIPFSLISIAAAAIVILLLIGQNFAGLQTIISIISLIIAMLCSPIWIMLALSSNESFPTPIRNIASAFCQTFNRVGSVAMPQILYLGTIWTPIPYMMFAIFSILAATLFGVFIKETKGIPLPDSMPQRERTLSTTVSLRRDSIAAYQPLEMKKNSMVV